MELATVTLNAPTTLNSSTERLILRIGKMVKDIMALAVLNSMSGKQIKLLMLIPRILAKLQAIIGAKELNVGMELRGRMEFAIKMVVI